MLNDQEIVYLSTVLPSSQWLDVVLMFWAANSLYQHDEFEISFFGH